MAVDQESYEPIPLAVPLALQGGEQPGHFIIGQGAREPDRPRSAGALLRLVAFQCFSPA
jgi:hypothetical protein